VFIAHTSSGQAAFDDLESTLDSVRTATGEVDSRRRAQQLLREHGYVRAIDTTETQGGAAADVPVSVEEGMPADDAVLEAVVRGVPGFTDENAESVLAVMRDIGVTSVADLEFVSQSDMADCKVTVIQTRKLLAAFAKLIAATTVAISDVPRASPAAEVHTCKIPLDSVATITAYVTAQDILPRRPHPPPTHTQTHTHTLSLAGSRALFRGGIWFCGVCLNCADL
jgi:hypothetical protein